MACLLKTGANDQAHLSTPAMAAAQRDKAGVGSVDATKMKSFPCYFLPVLPCYAEIGPLLFFSRNFARNP
jgi:hypothetical protein